MKRNIFRLYILFVSCSLVLLTSCNKDDAPGGDPDEPQGVGLPLISINTNGAVIVDEPKVNAKITVIEEDVVSYEGDIAIEFRGASSQALFPKKSYGFETRDSNNEDLDVPLLGFPEEEDWILNGPYSDKTLLRNVLIYDLSREMNMYASRTKLVELNVNDSYRGVYVFMEKLKRDSQRIAIEKLNESENSGEDLTGGYILKIDKVSGSNLGSGYNSQNSFNSSYTPPSGSSDKQIRFLYEYPKAEEITTAQKSYISTYISDFENALASDDFTDPTIGYAAYIDVNSFIDFFILNELSNNVDGFRLSTFMHKDKNSKLKMGPIWDFNLAFGNAGYCSGGVTNVWAYKFNERCSDDFWLIPFWWERLLEDPEFVNQLKIRWTSLRANTLSENGIYDIIDTYTNQLSSIDALDRNFQAWDILGEWIWPNNFVGNTYAEETAYFKNFIRGRLNWLDSNINAL